MTDYRLVIPILNSKVIGLVGPSWQLSAEAEIETILDEDHAAFLRDPPKNDGDLVPITAKVVNIRIGAAKPTRQDVLNYAALSQFCLNFFAVHPGVCIPWACTVAPGSKRQVSVVEYFDLDVAPISSVARKRVFKFNKDIKRPSLVGMHAASTKSLASFPGVIMATDRFCRALSRDDSHDRLVDLCICMESLIDGSNELRFRFSQIHAIIAEADLDKRAQAFKLFQDFYDARSKVVHGDPAASAKVAAVEARWDELVAYAKKSLAYYLSYLSDNNRLAWNQHISNVCLGIEQPNNGV